jgi:branched-chain amino acid transport system permease protein
MGVITPDSFDLFISIYLLIYTVVGGSKKFAGAVVGPLVLTLIPEVSRVLKEYQPFVFVAVLYGVVFFLPGGLSYLLERMSTRMGAILQRGIKANA